MPEPLTELTPGRGFSSRRLVVAIGGTLVLGVIAATIAQEHEQSGAEESVEESPAFDLSSLSSAIRTPTPARIDPVRDAGVEATDALREQVDRYLDARAAALRQLDAARRQGVDPDVIAAMAAVLGMPAGGSARSGPEASPPTDTFDSAPQRVSPLPRVPPVPPMPPVMDDEPRAL